MHVVTTAGFGCVWRRGGDGFLRLGGRGADDAAVEEGDGVGIGCFGGEDVGDGAGAAGGDGV